MRILIPLDFLGHFVHHARCFPDHIGLFANRNRFVAILHGMFKGSHQDAPGHLPGENPRGNRNLFLGAPSKILAEFGMGHQGIIHLLWRIAPLDATI